MGKTAFLNQCQGWTWNNPWPYCAAVIQWINSAPLPPAPSRQHYKKRFYFKCMCKGFPHRALGGI